MNSFKIEDDIPIPEVEEIEPVERSRSRRRGCKLWAHDWKPFGEGEKCSKCGEIFPCAHDCEHMDCREVKGQPQEDWITVKVADPS